MEMMYVKKIDNKYFVNKSLIGFVGDINDLAGLVNNIEVPKININLKVKWIIGKSNDYLKSLGLEESILNRKIKDLSETDLKLVTLIKLIILKPEMIILNNIEIGINDRINNRIIRFLKTIYGAFNIKFIIISRNVLYLNKIGKDVLIMKNGIIKYQGNLTLAMKQNLLIKPEIIKFIELANNKKAKLDETLDEKELLKAIYRSIN